MAPEAYERGTSERGTSTAPFVSRPAASQSTGSGSAPTPPSKRPRLTDDFEAKFDAFRKEYLRSVDYDPSNPYKAKFWQPVLQLTGRAAIDQGTDLANTWIDRVLGMLEADDVNACVKDLLETSFSISDAGEFRDVKQRVAEALKDVRDGRLGINSSEVTYDSDGWRCSGSYGYTGKVLKGETVICQATWTDTFAEYPDVQMLSRTLIHESLHRQRTWPLWTDYGLGHETLSQSTALRNPDTYAVFVQEAAKCSGR